MVGPGRTLAQRALLQIGFWFLLGTGISSSSSRFALDLALVRGATCGAEDGSVPAAVGCFLLFREHRYNFLVL